MNQGGEDAGLSAVSGTGRYVLFYGEFTGAAFGFAGSAYRSGAVGGANYEAGTAFPLVPFGYIDAWVVLPDHMHCVWTLPQGDDDFSNRWKAIKIRFVQKIPAIERRSNKGERGILQRRFWGHAIRDERDYANYIDYVHVNSLKHG